MPLTQPSAPTQPVAPIRVLVVDDSAFMRKMVTDILARDPALCVAGTARDGADALTKLDSLRPDVVTLDVEMPVMDGYGALAGIMSRRPTPVLMLSSLTQAGADATLRCLEMGAVDVVGKPSGSISLDIEKVAAELITKVKAAAGVRFPSRTPAAREHRTRDTDTRDTDTRAGEARAGEARVFAPPPAAVHSGARPPAVLIIGASTGGPRALQTLVPGLPADLGLPIVIVQHMPPGFTASLARRLSQTSPFPAREAEAGDRLVPGQILVAPGGHHLEFAPDGTARLTDDPPLHGVRPAVDVTLASLAHLYGPRVLAVLLTGMGRDGARGLKLVLDRGGQTLAEDESTCVVFGMPKAAADLGGVGRLLPLPALAPAITRLCRAEHGRETR